MIKQNICLNHQKVGNQIFKKCTEKEKKSLNFNIHES